MLLNEITLMKQQRMEVFLLNKVLQFWAKWLNWKIKVAVLFCILTFSGWFDGFFIRKCLSCSSIGSKWLCFRQVKDIWIGSKKNYMVLKSKFSIKNIIFVQSNNLDCSNGSKLIWISRRTMHQKFFRFYKYDFFLNVIKQICKAP